MVFYTPWFGFLNMSLIGHLPGWKVQIFEMSKNSPFFDPPNFGILFHKLAQICINMWIYGAFFFRWFKFTLKPPYTIVIGNFFSSIWDTSHWNFLSNLDSRYLETSPRTLLDQFWLMSIFGDSRAVRVICQKKMPSENQFFLFFEDKSSGFLWHICGSLEGTWHWLIWWRISPQVWTRVL